MHVLPNLQVGGMENGVVNVSNGLNRDIFEMSICCLNGMGPLRERLNEDVKVLDMLQAPGKAWHLPLRLARVFREENVDIIHTHNSFAAIYGISAGRLSRSCIVVHGEHGMIDFLTGYRKALKTLVCSLSHRITTVSAGLKEDVASTWRVPPEKIVAILNGVDMQKFCKREVTNIRAGDGLLVKSEDEVVLGAVGRLSDQKNYPFLLEALGAIVERCPKVKLVIVGDGPLRPELERMVDDLSIRKNVHFLGERSDVPEALSLMDIFLFPSYKSEGLANCLLEAMSVGLPVVASDIKGNSEAVEDNRTGFIFPTNSRSSFIEKVMQLVENEQLRRDFGVAGRNRIREIFSLERMMKNYEEFYLKELERRMPWRSQGATPRT